MSHGDEVPDSTAKETKPKDPTPASAGSPAPLGTAAADGASAAATSVATEATPLGGAGAGAEAGEAAADASATESDKTAEAESDTAAGAKMVRRVVCSYQMGWLPGDWLQTWRRLERTLARANLKVKATLSPLEDLPEDTDILVVPPELREAANAAAKPGTPILVTPASAAAGAFNDLVTRLEAGIDFTAEKVDPADKDKPKIVSYRGHTLLD